MTHTSDYHSRITTADEAVEVVRPGHRVWLHAGCSTPQTLIEALLRRAPELRNVEIIHMLTFGRADYTRAEYAGRFRHNGLFLGGNVRGAVAAGRADYTPISLSDIEPLFCSREIPLDVVFLQTTPPDANGFM